MVNLLPGHEDDPEQPVRILSRYAVTDLETGLDSVRTEMIYAQTADRQERIKVEDINELLLFMGKVVERTMKNPQAKTARQVLQYPRAREEDPIKGEVFMLGPQLMNYTFEERGDEIEVTGHRAVLSAKEKLTIPAGTRMTATVSMGEEDAQPHTQHELEELNPDLVVNVKAPTAEEDFTRRIRDAIALYNTMRS